MPRVWIDIEDVNEWEFTMSTTQGSETSSPVDMNASLYRQIIHAEKQYQKFQKILAKFYAEARKHPNSVRRVR